MNTYWHRHPRNFANECDILRTSDPELHGVLEESGFERISRDDLRRHVAWINGENDSCGSNRAFGAISFADILELPEYDAASHVINGYRKEDWDFDETTGKVVVTESDPYRYIES